MVIYILKAYPDENKDEKEAEIIGYFTSKLKLSKALKGYSWMLGISKNYWDYFFDELFEEFRRKEWQRNPHRDDYDLVSVLNNYLETGYIDFVLANEELC